MEQTMFQVLKMDFDGLVQTLWEIEICKRDGDKEEWIRDIHLLAMFAFLHIMKAKHLISASHFSEYFGAEQDYFKIKLSFIPIS